MCSCDGVSFVWTSSPVTPSIAAAYLGARYRRIASRRGPQKANVATQHKMLITIWHMGTTGTLYDDPGADYFTRAHRDRTKNRAIHQLEAMGYRVTLDQAG
jgi:transposase